MPKIIDHEAYRTELASKAVDVFIEHGYHGLGMRGIADAIGVSKSALYHYFPSKQELFAACTELITQPDAIHGAKADTVANNPDDDPGNDPITAMMVAQDSRFKGEMTLLLDYIRGMSSKEVAADPLLKMANARFLREIAEITGEDNAKQAYAMMLGGLLLRLFDGQQTDISEITGWLSTLPKQP